MRSDWVAASVRARSMAQRRVGAGTCRELAAAAGLQAVLPRLADSVYGDELREARTLAQAQRATRRTVLWQLRVLAGWLPAGGTRLIRAAAAAFEADNILALDRALSKEPARRELITQEPVPREEIHRAQPGSGSPDFDLGGLATAWPRLRTAATSEELRAALAASPWGDPGPGSSAADVLTVVWLRRLTSEAAAVRPWAAAAGVLICARLLLVEHAEPGERLVSLLRPLIGTGWTGSDTLQALRTSVPPASAQVLEGIESTSDLWRAEAGFAARVESDGFNLLRAGLPGPDVVLGAMAVLAADAWRVRAALAAATLNAATGSTTATGASGTSNTTTTGTSEVLDAVA